LALDLDPLLLTEPIGKAGGIEALVEAANRVEHVLVAIHR
jgi:hypothetical protein